MSKRLTDEVVRQIRDALEAATPGPWKVSDYCAGRDDSLQIEGADGHTVIHPGHESDGGVDEPDATLIVNAPQWLAWLLDERESLSQSQ